MTKLLLLSLVISFALLTGMCEPVPPPLSRTVVALIFCDVTNSLTKEENAKTGDIAARIVDKLPPGAVFKIYPIQQQTQLPAHISLDSDGNGIENENDYRIPKANNSIEAKEIEKTYPKTKEVRRQKIQDAINSLYDQLNKGPDNRSCIINVLGFASNKFQTEYSDNRKYDLHLYFVSDMIEECNVTPLANKVVEMDKPDIEAEIKRAEEFKSEWNLARVQIYCIFPSTRGTIGVNARHRPNREQVRIFWNTMFRACGIEPDAFKNGQVKWDDSGEPLEPLRGTRVGLGN